MADFRLTLYISGHNARSEQLIAALQTAFKQRLANPYELRIVDVLENPDVAWGDNVFTTPTLIRVSPPPPRRVIGDLFDTTNVLSALEL